MSHKPRHSLERSSSFSPSLIHKPQLSRKGVFIHEIPTHISPQSKKRRAKDMAKHISKKQKKAEEAHNTRRFDGRGECS